MRVAERTQKFLHPDFAGDTPHRKLSAQLVK